WIDAWPDLRDPATRGAALEVVRERWGRPDLSVRSSRAGRRWQPDCVGTPDALLDVTGNSEAEALVAALEAAPKVSP
ncbi:hypothetical protein, partial [Streptococcus pneumoniae]|uniref:hypothetical protein n=1 Tax=Streptococcus pneumoniae TaxID=1313 RepID=UPI001E43EF27